MRIISGTLKGRRFTPPTNLKARPTTDFAKEGLFNILNNQIDLEGLRVLELFSGSGSIGLEFISHEVASVDGIEISAQHIQYIKKVCKELDVTNYQLYKNDVFRFLKACKDSYDLVYADPPYQIKDLATLPDLVLNGNIVQPGGYFILEHGRDNNFESHPRFVNERKFGNVHFSFFQQV